MTLYNTLNVQLSNSRLNKLKPEKKNRTQVIINLLSKPLQGSWANIKFPKDQLSKMVQLGEFLGKLPGPLTKIGVALMGNALNPLAKSVLVLLGLITAASATDAAIQKKMFGWGTTILLFSNEELNDIIKIIKSLGYSSLLIEGVNEKV